ncbi:hypothetical protein JXA85_00840 [Candidatus Woesearchaeota archaeon]|nr:hypothetical protein [Candidatus Woesearchaeota archaeon]
MERIMLQPEQIIVPDEYELGDESILKIYFRVFDKGHGGDLPPAIVTKAGSIQGFKEKLEECYGDWETRNPDDVAARRKDYIELFGILNQHPYMLIDGNHKTAAATLTHNRISALELQTDIDFEEIQRMIELGELFDFKRPERNLDKLRESYVAQCLGLPGSTLPPSLTLGTHSLLKYTKTIRERVDDLTSSGDLPQYMIERYRRGK